jgi:cellobiose-specific phosphotransferase system component IIC
MAAVAMVTKVQKMLNSLQASQNFAVMFPHPTPLFWYLGFHGNAILNLSTCQKLPHTMVNIPTMFHEV